jgi:hypothetical protein
MQALQNLYLHIADAVINEFEREFSGSERVFAGGFWFATPKQMFSSSSVI